MHELETYSNNRSNSTEVTWLSIKKKKKTLKRQRSISATARHFAVMSQIPGRWVSMCWCTLWTCNSLSKNATSCERRLLTKRWSQVTLKRFMLQIMTLRIFKICHATGFTGTCPWPKSLSCVKYLRHVTSFRTSWKTRKKKIETRTRRPLLWNFHRFTWQEKWQL